MTCYDCGVEVNTAIRQFRLPKHGPKRGRFQDVCEACYRVALEADGYVLTVRNSVQTWSRSQEATR